MGPPFPGEHVPRHGDARRAAQPPDADFLIGFRRALIDNNHYCTREECCSFFVADDQDAIYPSAPRAAAQPVMRTATALVSKGGSDPEDANSNAGVPYPLMLFADFPDLPANDVLSELLREFHGTFVPSTPFVASMPLSSSGAPPYLVLSMALLGAAVSQNPENNAWAARLWRPTCALLTGVVEVDNSIARKLEWMQAGQILIKPLHSDDTEQGLLFVTYGTLQNDMTIWHHTHACYGIVDTTIHRLTHADLVPTGAHGDTFWSDAPYRVMSSVVSYHFLVGALQAIQMQTPPAITAAEVSFTLSNGRDNFSSVYRRLVVDHHPLPRSMSTQEYLIVLVALLSDIVSLCHVYGAMGASETLSADGWRAEVAGGHQNAGPARASSSLGNAPPETWLPRPPGGDGRFDDDDDSEAHGGYPWFPCSAQSEYHRLRRSLRNALELWRTSVGISEDQPRSTEILIDKTTVPLVNFCDMMLEVGPGLLMLPNIVAYPPRASDTPKPPSEQNRTAGLRFSTRALSCAWQILESVDAGDSVSPPEMPPQGWPTPSDPSSQNMTPIWYPITLFYAALVVWAGMLEENSRGGVGVGISLPKKKLLGAFQTELEQIRPSWGCVRKMIAIINGLK